MSSHIGAQLLLGRYLEKLPFDVTVGTACGTTNGKVTEDARPYAAFDETIFGAARNDATDGRIARTICKGDWIDAPGKNFRLQIQDGDGNPNLHVSVRQSGGLATLHVVNEEPGGATEVTAPLGAIPHDVDGAFFAPDSFARHGSISTVEVKKAEGVAAGFTINGETTYAFRDGRYIVQGSVRGAAGD